MHTLRRLMSFQQFTTYTSLSSRCCCCVHSTEHILSYAHYTAYTLTHKFIQFLLSSISCKQNCAFDGYNFNTNTRLLSLLLVVCMNVCVVYNTGTSFYFSFSFIYSPFCHSSIFLLIQNRMDFDVSFFTLSFLAIFLYFLSHSLTHFEWSWKKTSHK